MTSFSLQGHHWYSFYPRFSLLRDFFSVPLSLFLYFLACGIAHDNIRALRHLATSLSLFSFLNLKDTAQSHLSEADTTNNDFSWATLGLVVLCLDLSVRRSCPGREFLESSHLEPVWSDMEREISQAVYCHSGVSYQNLWFKGTFHSSRSTWSEIALKYKNSNLLSWKRLWFGSRADWEYKCDSFTHFMLTVSKIFGILINYF